MIQFYFLSVLLNLLVGLVLVCISEQRGSEERELAAAGFRRGVLMMFGGNTARIVLGLLAVFIGIMKLLSVVQGDIPIMGDLIPALSGIAGGGCILLLYYRERSSLSDAPVSAAERLFVGERKYIGIFCIAAGVLHFIFPRVLFL